MGGASKLLMLLSSPLPHPCSAFRLTRHPRITITALSSFPKRRFSSTTTINCRPLLRFSIHNPTSHEQIHTHTASVTRNDFHTNLRSSHPWPEWSKLVDNLRVGGYFDSQVGLDGENALSVFKDLPQDFLQAVTACLAFARCRTDLLRSLSRKDIEIVVGNGSPILFKNGVDSARRMKSFLRNYEGNELEFERASTVDLMRFLLSYAYNPLVSDRNNFGNGELVEASARNLLSELADASTVVHEFDPSSSMPKQLSDRYGQTTRPLRQNIEMKRGDWICPRCSFMNFARNMKCLDCNEARPNRQLTGGEWECPQCDFFNYGKNVVCLRCDCRRPGEVSFRTAESQFSAGFNNESDLDKADMTNSRTTLGNDGNEGNSFRSVDGRSLGKSTSTHMSQSLDRVLGCTSPVSEMNYNATAGNNTAGEGSSFSSSTSPQSRPCEGIKSDYVPFVPLPTDTFAIPQKHTEKLTGNSKSIGQKSSVDSFPFSQKSVNRTDCKENKEQAEQSERWSHDDADITNAISDEDFPEIMPMHKGESRFVVGKRKDRSLTSPLHKRRMAMEQTNTTNFVPFVPFPPDYFAKKDKEPESGATSTTPEVHAEPQKSEEHNVGLPDSRVTRYSPQSVDNGLTNGDNWSTSFSGKSMNESKVDHGYSGYSTQRTSDLRSGDGESWSGSSWNNNRSGASTSIGSLSQQSEKVENTRESWKGGFSGKSLEGSLVKEPDPLDMSEEAKAERFFRRVAQIKDISELSQIPDEDFPQIMPMRKGVNRFVVSKRKTPLERRLTSSQYRRNLPIVNSELKKEENNES